MSAPQATYLTPPAVARRYGVDPAKVLTWIRNGEARRRERGYLDRRPATLSR